MTRELSEENLRRLKKARQFDGQALGEIYDLYSDQLYAYAVRKVGNAQQAEDLVGKTFERFLQALKTGDGPDRYPRAYLYQTTKNLISDHYRSAPPQPVKFDELLHGAEVVQPPHILKEQQAAEQVHRALERIPETQREVLELKFLENLSNQEVALLLEKTIGAVKSLQHRGLDSLRRELIKDFTP
jgi:RNA polymerase sigma-70 factor (ECF subfamily)